MPEVIINGPAGRLECRYMPGATPDSPTALVLHPGGAQELLVNQVSPQACSGIPAGQLDHL